MKRDARMHRLGERRDSAHGGKYGRRPRYRTLPAGSRADALLRIARALHLPPEILAGPSAYDAQVEAERRWVEARS